MRFVLPLALLALLGAGCASTPPEEDPVQIKLNDLDTRVGRMERIASPKGFTVVIDYAHTEDALRQVMAALRKLKPKRLVTVFGCGGDRDRTKRPLMGQAAAEMSDEVIVTSDNPRSEDPGRNLYAPVSETVQEHRAQPGSLQPAAVPTMHVQSGVEVEIEEVLHHDDVALAALHLRDVRDPSGPVLESCLMHDEIDRRCHLIADRPLG